MKKIALPVLTVCFALAALVFAYLWYVEKSNDSDIKQLAQASATGCIPRSFHRIRLTEMMVIIGAESLHSVVRAGICAAGAGHK